MVLVLAAGCGEPAPPAAPPETDPGDVVEQAPRDTWTPIAPLEAGAVRVRVDGSSVSLQANEAPRSDVLRALARETGTRLDVSASGIEDRRITARIDDAPLFDVLSLVLRGVEYELVIGFDPLSQTHRVSVLRARAGVDATPGASALAGVDVADPLALAIYELLDNDDPVVVQTALEVLARAGDPRSAAEIEPLLDDDDPIVREAAAEALDALEPVAGSD